MSWVATAIVGTGVVTAGVSYLSGQKASKDAKDAAETASDATLASADIEAQSQQAALDYVKETEAIPQEFRLEALTKLGGLYGLGSTEVPGPDNFWDVEDWEKPFAKHGYGHELTLLKMQLDDINAGNQTTTPEHKARIEEYIRFLENMSPEELNRPMSAEHGTSGISGTSGQQELIDQAISSPLYGAIMSGQEFGEEAIMRNAGMTGGLRSGNVQGNMYDYNVQLQNRALLESYNQQLQGLTGLAGIPSNTNQVAGMMSGIGTTQAGGVYDAGMAESLGQVASSQAKQTGTQNMVNNLLGFGELAVMYSDRRLKSNIKKIGEINGYNFYSFDWNSIANKMGLTGSTCGCMADEIFNKVPDAVFLKDNFMMVNYSMIGVL